MRDGVWTLEGRRMRVFISYGHDEHVAIAERLSQDLTERGHHVWFDAERLKKYFGAPAAIEKSKD